MVVVLGEHLGSIKEGSMKGPRFISFLLKVDSPQICRQQN